MAIPDRTSVETQVASGQPTTPPYETPMYLLGRRGLDLVSGIDALPPEALSRSLNVRALYGAPLEVRPGETALGTTTGTDHINRLFRLNDPANSAFARFAGSGTHLYRGTTGAFTDVDSGYSGDPLIFTAVTLPLTGLPFVFVSDRSRMRKIDRTNAVQTIGLGNGLLTSTALGAILTISVAQFQASDTTAAASWTKTAGTDTAGTATGVPTAADTGPVADKAVAFTTVPGSAGAGLGYSSIASIAKAMDLSAFAGPVTVTGDDMIAFDVLIDQPLKVLSYTVYLVVSAFTTGVIPGRSATQNLDSYFKTFSGSEIQAIVHWGNTGFPVRRSEFTRIGSDATATWATVTGIVLVLQTNTNQAVTLTFNGMYVEGGSGPDTSDVDDIPYDYRVTNYNPTTGTESNPSAIQAASLWLNPIRQPVTVTPTATGTAALRQRVYRRGGSPITAGDWFYVGVNTSDGGAFSDTSSDASVATAATLAIDNDQPVTSVDSSGATVLNQVVPVFFLVEDYCFALGDPLQPGRLYRSKQGAPENWPAASYVDVCATSEELMNGGMLGSAGFVFSRTRMYSILLNSDGSWTTDPTGCSEGMVGRWAMAVTPFGIAFVSPTGVRLTAGGSPDPISDQQIGPLFRGETVRGLSPVDLTVPTALQLEYHANELWMTYADTGGARRQLIYNFYDKTWRPYLFGTTVSTVYSEPVQGAQASLLLGSNAAGAIYTHSGFSDLGSGIAYSFRTGATDFGEPRVEKLLGEIILDAEIQTTTLTVQAFLNDELTSVSAQTVVGVAGLRRYTFEPFGTAPQRARNVAVECSGTASTSAKLYFNRGGVSRQLQPEITLNLPSPWEELPGGEGYVWGCLITCDTGDVDRSVVVEYTVNNGAITTAATLTVHANGRKKLPFSWGAVLAQQIRIRPTGSCLPWIRFKLEWLSDPEPPRLTGWDSNWLSLGTYADKWLKGYLIEADTFNAAKTVVIDIDQSNAVQSNALTFNGRGIQHISFAKQKGRLFRLRSTDANFGKFYRWQPIFDEEPLAITRWETQERPHQGMAGRWQKPLEGFIAVRSSASINLLITSYGLNGASLDASNYTLASTAGAKQKLRVPLNAAKGLLFSYLFTSASPFWLYKEESELLVEDWATGQAAWTPLPVSNDDLDPSRQMGNAELAASTPGGAMTTQRGMHF